MAQPPSTNFFTNIQIVRSRTLACDHLERGATMLEATGDIYAKELRELIENIRKDILLLQQKQFDNLGEQAANK